MGQIRKHIPVAGDLKYFELDHELRKVSLMTIPNGMSRILAQLGVLAMVAVSGGTIALAQKQPASNEPSSVSWKARN